MLNIIGATNYNKKIKVGDKIEAGTEFKQFCDGKWHTNILKATGVVSYVSSAMIQVVSQN